MTRYALLIEAARAKGQKEIIGCERDVERLKAWLTSVAGGAWNEAEVKILHNPTKSEITASKWMLDIADFAFLSFSGHGRIVEDFTGKRAQMITIGTGEEIDFNDLKPRAGRAILSCDACREVHRLAESRAAVKSAAKYAREITRFTRQDYRTKFEQSVMLAAPGTFTMYSCSPGQCAGDDPLNGGVFTDALLNRAGEMYDGCQTSAALSIETVFSAARRSVSQACSDQTPIGGPSSRSGNPFPFVVHLA